MHGLSGDPKGDEPTAGAPAEFTIEERKLLKEFAANMSAGRRLMRLVAWLGGISTAIAMCVYYVLSAYHSWGGQK